MRLRCLKLIWLTQLLCFSWWSCIAQSGATPNGISVGKPKVFDNRTLTLMLESLSQALQGMQFVDQKGVASALSNTQGFRSTETTSDLAINTLPIPGLTQQVVKNTGVVDSSGNALPDSSQTTTTNTRDSVTPQPPALESAPAFSGFTPKYGEASADLLSDQVNLNYQIFNLRMILERALSDRLQGSDTRLQTVLGFNITIDPPRTANDAVAVIEITLKAATAGDLSLVALMPQEKTYNSAALSTKSNSFGGSAVVHMVQIGYSQRRRSQTFYLYRDNDTIAYERMNPNNSNEIIFGWMFRPVLGRRSVSPGLRQLFAIASLPAVDSCSPDQAKAKTCPQQQLTARVRTYWKKYDAATLTSFESRDVNRGQRFKYATTLGLARPELFAARYVNESLYNDIRVETTAGYQQDLGPAITNVSWVPVGAKSALVSVGGKNFFTGTQVRLGDRSYASTADGLILKSNEAFDLSTTMDALAAGSAAVVGRYGTAIPLIRNDPQGRTGIVLDRVEIGPSLSGTRTLNLYLAGADPAVKGQPLTLEELPQDLSPLVSVNGNTVPLPYAMEKVVEHEPDGHVLEHVMVRGAIPDSFLAGGSGTVRISWPFLGERWTSIQHFSDPDSVHQAFRTTDKSMLITSKGDAGFVRDPHDPGKDLAATSCWRLFASDKPLKMKTRICSSGDEQTEPAGENAEAVTLKNSIPDRIVLVDPYGATFFVDVQKSKGAEEPGAKSIAVNQYDAIWIEVPVEDTSRVSSVEADRFKLKFSSKPATKPGEKSKSIKVELTREITSKPGNVDVTVLDRNSKLLTVARVQIACVDCKSGGK